MSTKTQVTRYDVEDACEDIKRVIRIAQTGEPVTADEEGHYALYAESGKGQRYVLPAEYDPEADKFLCTDMLIYDASNREVRVAELKEELEACDADMTPKNLERRDFEAVKESLESD